jgi:branched-chain amino acid transport system ATP-binding protein
VAIIAALAAQPRLLIVDEPSMGLSPVATQAIRADLAMAAQQGCTMVLIESKLDLVRELCQRVLVMDRGQITHDGSVESAAEALRRHYASDY